MLALFEGFSDTLPNSGVILIQPGWDVDVFPTPVGFGVEKFVTSHGGGVTDPTGWDWDKCAFSAIVFPDETVISVFKNNVQYYWHIIPFPE